MKKRLAIILGILATTTLIGCGTKTREVKLPVPEEPVNVFIGDIPITEYAVTYEGSGAKQAALLLSSYIDNITGLEISVNKNDSKQNRIQVIEDKKAFINEESGETYEDHTISIIDGNVLIQGSNDEELEKAIYAFANAYLGYEWAGTMDERLCYESTTLRIPWTYEIDNPWMKQREPIITLWNVNSARGAFLNENTSLKVDIMSFSDDQLYEYVRMMKNFGFTGIQVTDMCSAWAGAGGISYCHDKIRTMANAAHSMDMDFTLWVWGSEFTGYGWVDNDVTYDVGDYGCARNNPEVQACFDRYYDYYAELADCSDRVIAHFYDPGNLGDANDVAYFASVLRDKFKAVNPEIDFGVSCWVDCFDKDILVATLGNDVTLYEGMQHDDTNLYGPFRQTVSNLNCRLGTWEWNGCEMEIDQLAQMNYQPTILQETYQTIRNYDGIMTPEYWSTMDSYHVLNAFSLYCSSRLLQNPDEDLIELTEQVATLTVGDEYASDFADILLLIEEARSGYTWNQFFWSKEENLLKGNDYPYEDIIAKCERLIPALNEMIDSSTESNGLPLPMPLKDVLSLIKPHLSQIYEYALFRRQFDEFKTSYDGLSEDEVYQYLEQLGTPIAEYNCVIGLWGQIEARVQRELIVEFCQSKGIEVPKASPDYDLNRKFRIYSYFCMYQKGHNEPVAQYPPYFQYGAAYNEYDTPLLVEELVEDGVFTKNKDDDGVYLTDWDNYRFAFN